jgi:hypothetical protein
VNGIRGLTVKVIVLAMSAQNPKKSAKHSANCLNQFRNTNKPKMASLTICNR